MPSIPYSYWDEEEQRRLEAEASQQEQQAQPQTQSTQQPSQPSQPQQPEQTVREAAQSVEKEELNRGISTNVGEAVQAIDPRNLANGLAALANMVTPEDAGKLKEFTQFLDDKILSNRETLELTAEASRKQYESGDVIGGTISQTAVGLAAGSENVVATPFTLAARLENADSSYVELPSEMKDSVAGELGYEVGRILFPTLIGLPAGGTLIKRTAIESGIETLPVRSSDDILLGREAAIKLGEIAEIGGYDGKQLTRDLIEGKDPKAQAINMVAGYFVNWGINITADTLLGKVGKLFGRIQVSQAAKDVAEATGKNAEDVQLSLDDIELPAGKGPDYDIHEQTTIDTGVVKPKGEKAVISEEAIQATILRRGNNPLLEDALTEQDHIYFAQLDKLTDEQSFKSALSEGTKYVEALVKGGADKAAILQSAQEWTKKFFDSSTNRFDFEGAIDDFAATQTQPLKPSMDVYEDLLETGLDKAYLLEDAITTPEGAVAATLIGEELSVRLHRAARSVMNMENGGKNWEAAVKQFLKLQDKGELFLTPLRRYRRKWNVEGVVIQKKNVAQAGGQAPIKGSKGNKEYIPYDAPSKKFRQIKQDVDDTGSTLKEMLKIYRDTGDKDIKKSIDAYFAALAYSPPKVAIQMMDNVSGTMRAQLKKGNKDAYRQLLYASYLTRLKPQTASVVSNIANLIKEPVGLALSGDRAYAKGQVAGAWAVMSDAFQVGKRAFQTGHGVNSGSKLDASFYDFKQKQLNLEKTHQGALREINSDTSLSKKEKAFQTFWANWDYMRQSIANHPLNSYAGRLFLGGDEWSKVVYGGMTAAGRAYREGAANKIKGGAKLEKLVKKHMDEIFQEGTSTGKINTDKDAVGDVLGAANAITFSQSIPKDGNVIDQAFRALQDKGRDTAFWNFVSPFTRVSYWTMEKGGVLMAGSLGPPGKWLLTRIPRYKKTLAGEYGELAQLQLKSNLAFAQYTSLMVGSLSTMGLMTGNNPPEGMPKTSFIIPTNNKQGYIAIPYGRIEPIATQWAVIADTVKAFRDNSIGEGEYLEIIRDISIASGLATLDKSFMTGMSNTANLLDIKNFTEPSSLIRSSVSAGSGLVSSQLLPLGGAAALTRMISEWVQPYETLNRGDANNWRNLFAAISQRNFGGLTNPVKNDPLTGQPVAKAATVQDIMGAALSEGLVPGAIKKGENQDIYSELELMGYESKKFYDGTRTANGIPLSLELQSKLQADIHTYGGLAKRLRKYFKPGGEYEKLSTQLKNSRKDTSLEGQMRTERLEKQLRTKVDYYYGQAKQRAISVGRVGKDDQYLKMKRIKESSRNPAALKGQAAGSQSNSLFDAINMYK